MNDLRSICPRCGGEMTITSELSGQVVVCPHCNESVQLPKSKSKAGSKLLFAGIGAGLVLICLIVAGGMWIARPEGRTGTRAASVPPVIYTNLTLEELEAKASAGDSQAQFILGCRYFTGQGAVTNFVEATNWLTKAAEQGDAPAMTALGASIMANAEEHLSISLTNDDLFKLPANVLDQALGWYRKAADLGDTNAMWKLIDQGILNNTNTGVLEDQITGIAEGLPTSEGVGLLGKLVEKGDRQAMVELGGYELARTNTQAGLDWLSKASDLGENRATTQLARLYEDGRGGLPTNIIFAESYWEKAATNGDMESCYHLAGIYEKDTVIKNPAKAFKWYHLLAMGYATETNAAAKLIMSLALVPVAKAYETGEGVEQSDTNALKWYTEAAESGDPEAQWRLGLKYDLGKGVDQDKQKALYWYLQAAKRPDLRVLGVVESERNIGYLYQEKDGVGPDNQEAFKWFSQAAEYGDAGAEYEVGKAYESGVGVLKDVATAFKWYEKSATKGNKDAEVKMGNLFSSDLRSSENRIKAYAWYALAAASGDEDAAALRDNVSRVMSRQEVNEAIRRAKALDTLD